MKKKELLVKLWEAYKGDYIVQCPKCGSFKVGHYVDEDYFSNPLRAYCSDCKEEWAG